MTDTNYDREVLIQRLQTNLAAIRKIAGWSASDLGERIGVTKQTISNLENSKSKMNFTQYIAIRSVLDAEVESNPDNELLQQVIKMLLDSGDELDEETYDKVRTSTSAISAAIAGGAAAAAVAPMFMGALPAAALALASAAAKLPWKKLLK